MATIAERRAALAAREQAQPQGGGGSSYIQQRRAAKFSQGRPEAQALPDRRPAPDEPFDFSAVEMVKNIPGSFVQSVKDTVMPLLRPDLTAKSLRDLAVGVASKAFGLDDPAEETVKALTQFYKQRYGTIERAKRTLQEDPAGLALDLSAVLTAGGAAAARAPGQIGKAGRAIAKTGQALDVPGNMVAQGLSGTSQALGRGAERVMESAAGFSTTMPNRKRVIRALLDEGISITPGGLVKAQRIVESINDRLDGLMAAADARYGMVPTQPVFDAIDEMIAEVKQTVGGDTLSEIKKLEDFKKNLRATITDSNGEVQSAISPSKAQRSKRAAWKKAFKAGRKGKTDKAERNRRVGEAFRRGIEETVTEGPVHDLNARQGPLLQALPALERSLNSQGNLNLFPRLGSISLGGASYAGTGDLTTAIGTTVVANALSGRRSKSAIARSTNFLGNRFGDAAAALYTQEGLAGLQVARELREAEENR